MTLFYRGPCARVTHEVFEVRCPSYQVFAISELRHVHVADDTSQLLAASAPARVCSTALVGVSAVAAVAGWSVFDRPMLTLAAVAVLATSLVASVVCWCTRRNHELRGIYRGGLVCLFRTTDSLLFGQVSRALRRALERLEDARIR